MWQAIYHEFGAWTKRLVAAILVPKTAKITIQTDRLLIIRQRRSTRAWCRECGHEVEMVGLSQAAALTGGGKPVLPASIQGNGWHVSEDQNGSPLICLESVLKRMGDSDQGENDQ